MNGRDFLDIAQGLVGGTSEGHWRTAAGRAYYALLLEGRDTLGRWGFSIVGHQPVHAFVRLRFSFAADADCKRIGDALDRLVRLRNEADYQLSGSRSFASNIKAIQAIALARDALTRLDSMQTDAIRQTAVIAAIQAAGS